MEQCIVDRDGITSEAHKNQTACRSYVGKTPSHRISASSGVKDDIREPVARQRRSLRSQPLGKCPSEEGCVLPRAHWPLRLWRTRSRPARWDQLQSPGPVPPLSVRFSRLHVPQFLAFRSSPIDQGREWPIYAKDQTSRAAAPAYLRQRVSQEHGGARSSWFGRVCMPCRHRSLRMGQSRNDHLL